MDMCAGTFLLVMPHQLNNHLVRGSNCSDSPCMAFILQVGLQWAIGGGARQCKAQHMAALVNSMQVVGSGYAVRTCTLSNYPIYVCTHTRTEQRCTRDAVLCALANQLPLCQPPA